MDNIPDQIGERLRSAREKAGLEVDDVVFKTRLPRSAIEALEAEDFSHFTSQVYAKSFLSQYSVFLNVEATQWLDALKPSTFIEGDPLLPLLETASMSSVEVRPGGESSGSWMSTVWLLALSCGIVLGAIKVFEFFEARFGVELTRQSTERNTSNSQPAEKAPEPVAPPKNPPTPDPALPGKPEEAFRPAPRAIIVR